MNMIRWLLNFLKFGKTKRNIKLPDGVNSSNGNGTSYYNQQSYY